MHSLKDRESCKNLERKVDSAVLGEFKLREEIGGNSDYFQEINQESEFQRFHFVGPLGSERQDQFVWRI